METDADLGGEVVAAHAAPAEGEVEGDEVAVVLGLGFVAFDTKDSGGDVVGGLGGEGGVADVDCSRGSGGLDGFVTRRWYEVEICKESREGDYGDKGEEGEKFADGGYFGFGGGGEGVAGVHIFIIYWQV